MILNIESRYDKLRRLVEDLLKKGEIDEAIYQTMMDEIKRLEEKGDP